MLAEGRDVRGDEIIGKCRRQLSAMKVSRRELSGFGNTTDEFGRDQEAPAQQRARPLGCVRSVAATRAPPRWGLSRSAQAAHPSRIVLADIDGDGASGRGTGTRHHLRPPLQCRPTPNLEILAAANLTDPEPGID